MTEIRSADPGDADAVVGLLAQLGYSPERAGVERDLATGSAGDVVVAVDDGSVMGVMAYRLVRQLHWGATVACLEVLVVDEASRSTGVGAAMVEHLVQRASATGAILIELHSNAARMEARRFYERLGFEVTSNYFVRRL